MTGEPKDRRSPVEPGRLNDIRKLADYLSGEWANPGEHHEAVSALGELLNHIDTLTARVAQLEARRDRNEFDDDLFEDSDV